MLFANDRTAVHLDPDMGGQAMFLAQVKSIKQPRIDPASAQHVLDGQSLLEANEPKRQAAGHRSGGANDGLNTSRPLRPSQGN